jgi:hypothetical protein
VGLGIRGAVTFWRLQLLLCRAGDANNTTASAETSVLEPDAYSIDSLFRPNGAALDRSDATRRAEAAR